ncbi:MAG TPA: aminotransferase class IV [Chlamydiales bacterium]|nr:aminotransferase class IV [Chlamydiales bacterium]
MQYCFINGEIKPLKSATLSVLDLGFLRGVGIFEYLRTYHHKYFHLEDHYIRFQKSAEKFHIPFNLSFENLQKILERLLEVNEMQEDYGIKMVLTGGVSDHPLTPSKEPSLLIFIEKLPCFNEIKKTGMKVATYPFTRKFAEYKTTSYLEAILAFQNAKDQNAHEAIYVDQEGYLLEGTRSNFFAIKNNTLFTPNHNVLPGITRKVVLSISQNVLNIEKRRIHITELMDMDEAFLTSTTFEIMPIRAIDQYDLSKTNFKTIHKLQNLFHHYSDPLMETSFASM